jgi:hypothetical protein
VEYFWLQVSVEVWHFPILVPGDEHYLFNGRPSLEKAARAFVTQIVQMKVMDLQFSALAAKCCSNGSSVVRKNTAFANIQESSLFLNDLACVIARPGRCKSSPLLSTAGGSDAECPSALVLLALFPARTAVSSRSLQLR